MTRISRTRTQWNSSREANFKRALAGESIMAERTFRSLDGRNIRCELRLARLPHERRQLLRVSIIDITQRKEAEEALRDHFEVLNSVLTTARDGFWRLDAQGHILDVNPACCQQSGYTREELLGMHISDFEAREGGSNVAQHIERVIKKGDDLFESTQSSQDGSLWRLKSVRLTAQFEKRRVFRIPA